MAQYSPSIQRLMDLLGSLPGIGSRGAERIAFYLLKQSTDHALQFADAIRDVKTLIRNCSVCFNITEADPCSICGDPARDRSKVCVVEQPKDLLAIESARSFDGVYHVLLGRISPQHNENPEDITLAQLQTRLADGGINELILATNPTTDGDLTSLHIQAMVRSQYPNVVLSRPARGLAAGSQIEYANRNVLSDAFTGRQTIG